VAGGDHRAEEDALVQALADLKAATRARRKLRADSPELLAAIRHEREAMERIWAIVEKKDRGGR
jgi:ribonuclease HI